MPALTQQNQQAIRTAAGGDVKGMAVVKLYTTASNPSSWSEAGVTGGAAVVSSGGRNYVRIYDLQSSSLCFEQEFYGGMDYAVAKSFFHTFEITDAVAGLSFADEGEAHAFASAVKGLLGGSKTTTTSAASSSKPSPSRKTSSSSGGSTKKKKKRGGFFSKMKTMLKGDDAGPGEEFVLSGPTGFRHESHIGWDPENGFEIRNIPPAWRKLFQAAGVKKSELKDADTAKFIMDTVATAVMGENPTDRQAPPAPPGGGPPPPPSAPAPPPAPGAPPPPPAGGGAAAGAAAGGAGGGSRGGLLSQIQAGRELKHVESGAGGGLPDIEGMDETGKGNIADTLANALMLRRADMNDSDAEEEDDASGWSDEY